MPIRIDTAARHLCERSGWSLSNLPLQKLLYLAQVEYASPNAEPLLDAGFQAWDYGPVAPALYGRLRMFGADEIDHDVFYDALRLRDGTRSKNALDITLDTFGGVSPGKLIELTHWDRGAWARRYEPGVRRIPISQRDIEREAENRIRYRDEWEEIVSEVVD